MNICIWAMAKSVYVYEGGGVGWSIYLALQIEHGFRDTIQMTKYIVSLRSLCKEHNFVEMIIVICQFWTDINDTTSFDPLNASLCSVRVLKWNHQHALQDNMGLTNTIQYNHNKFVSFKPTCKGHIHVKTIKICPLWVSLNETMSSWMVSYR